MGKEAKIGLGIISILLIVLGVVVFRRVWGPKELPDVSIEKPTTQSGAGDGEKSTTDGTTLLPAKHDTPNGAFGQGSNAHQWVGAADRIADDGNAQADGALNQPRTALMPKSGLSPGLRTPNSQGTENQGDDRFGRPATRNFNDENFGTGRNNVLRPSANDGASSRTPSSAVEPQQVDPGLGRLRPTAQAQLQPGPTAIQTGEETTTTQAQYTVQQPYGTQSNAGVGSPQSQFQYGAAATVRQSTPRDGSPASSALGGTFSTGRYGTGTYGSSAYGADPYRSAGTAQTTTQNYGGASARDITAGDGGLVQNNGSYTVQPNDNFWLVSKKVYGRGDFYKALIEHNRNKFPDPSRIRVGDVVATPDIAQLRKNYPVFCPKQRRATSGSYHTASLSAAESRGQRVYVVQAGDTVFNIARDELGKSARWAEICRLNRDLLGDDYDHLKPGWKLLLPASSTATTPSEIGQQQDTLTRQIWQKIR